MLAVYIFRYLEKIALTEQKDTVDGIFAIAEKKLDMVDKDTVLYDVVPNQN